VTTLRSDPGADRTTGDATRGVSIRLRCPVGQKYEVVFGERDGECMVREQKTTPKPVSQGASGIRTPSETRFSAVEWAG
jgi:hypothetical protein